MRQIKKNLIDGDRAHGGERSGKSWELNGLNARAHQVIHFLLPADMTQSL